MIALGLVGPALGRDRLGQEGRGGRQVIVLAHLLEPLVVAAQVGFGRGRVAGQHGHEARRVGDRRGHGHAQLLEGGHAPGQQRRRASVGPVLHGVQAGQVVEDHRLAGLVAADLLQVPLAALDALRGRGRAPQRGRRQPAEDLGELPLVTGPAGVDGRLPPGVLGGGRAGLDPVRGRPEPPCLAEPDLVGVPLEGAQQLGQRLPTSRCGVPDVHLQPQQQPLDPGPGGQPPVAGGRGDPAGVLQRRPAWSSWPASIRAAPRPVWARARAGSSAGRSEDARCSSRTAAGTSPRACALVPAASRWPAARRARRPDLVVDRPQLAPVADRLLQVVADDLVLGGLPLGPAGEALVQLGAVRLGDGAVGRLLDQQVVEVELRRGRRGAGGAATSPLAASARRWRPSGPRAWSGSSSATASRVKSRPTTAARHSTARSPGPSSSRRAASRAWMVAGSSGSSSPQCCSPREAASCSRNSGLPAATSSSRSRLSGGAPASACSRAPASSSASGPSSTRIAAATPAAQAGPPLQQLAAGPGRAPAAPAWPARRRPRPGRGRWARPSAGPPGRPAAAAAGPASPAAGGSPRRSRGRPGSPARPGRAPRPATRRPGPASASPSSSASSSWRVPWGAPAWASSSRRGQKVMPSP